ncbi:hypothetical protein [Rubricoccus marinus]|uniref:Outer membrane protein beta-barrel domain-containing protein n=1 Tax=Rubricoccus marinus TaxID=716817 RepID=A0A259U2C6_9BACT|nr:hypothetical protein [Rubricoccus marinus]OZC04132.1 hypothetical protein BSZ36_14760 [Rubricoccus marinus]
MRLPAAALLVLLATGASAQVRLSAGATLPLAGSLGPVWEEQPGARGTITFSAYGGEVRLALDLAMHDAAEGEATPEAAPDFLAVNATLGWGPVLDLGPVRLSPGAEVGAGRFAFDDDGEFGGNLSSESELLAGAYVRAGVPLAGRVEAWAETGVRRTFFSTPQTTAGAAGGLTLRLW